MALIESKMHNNVQYAVYGLEGEAEEDCFRKLVEAVQPKCPQCGGNLTKCKMEDMRVLVQNPLASMEGITMGTAVPRCPMCGTLIPINGTMMDLLGSTGGNPPFPSIAKLIQDARSRSKEATNGKAK